MKPNWRSYKDIYDIYQNGSRICKNIYGRKAAITFAERKSGSLFGRNRLEVVNIFTGEVIYDIE